MSSKRVVKSGALSGDEKGIVAASPSPRIANAGDIAPRSVAVIDIGATSIRMAIAEIHADRGIRIIDHFSQAVSLGKDTFTLGRIRKSTMEECVKILRSYKDQLGQQKITQPEQMRVVATSAVREATNRLAFIDRAFIATGLSIEALDEAEVNRITYMGIQPLLQNNQHLASKPTVVAEIGSGSSEILMVCQGNVLFSNTYRLGSLRLLETLEKFDAPSNKLHSIMESQIHRMVEQIVENLNCQEKVQLVCLGGDVRFVARHLIDGWDGESLASIPVDKFATFARQMLQAADDEIANRFDLTAQDAETLGPALLSYYMLAKELGCESIEIADTNLRDGLLNEFAVKDAWTTEFREQSIRSAISLGEKYSVDRVHAEHVALLGRKLFAELQSEHQLEPRMELLLTLAALLHEVGMYVNVRSNHKHAMYLIRNSEMFGLSRKDVLLISLVARYHRRTSPHPEHDGFSALDRNDRVVVSKLASLLRVAIALDESRSQRIKNIRCRVDDNRLVITAQNVEDVSLEQLTLRQTGSLFEETFGLGILLRTTRR